MSETALAVGVCEVGNSPLFDGIPPDTVSHLLLNVESLLKVSPRSADQILIDLVRECNLPSGEETPVTPGGFAINESALEYYRVAELWRRRYRDLEDDYAKSLDECRRRLQRWVIGLTVLPGAVVLWSLYSIAGALSVR